MTQEKPLKLDTSIKSTEERINLVNQIIEQTPENKLTPYYLSKMSDYILNSQTKESKEVLTDNRMVTINRRETSYEGLAGKLENGEDGIYNLASNLGKQAFLTQKKEITAADLEEVPGLKQLHDAIEEVEKQFARSSGKQRYALKKQIIEMRQDQYILKNSYRSPVSATAASNVVPKTALPDKIYFDENDLPQNDGLISLFNPKHISALLCNYSGLKQEFWGDFKSDFWYVMEDLDNLIDAALLPDYPLYYELLIMKIDGCTNLEIQAALEEQFNIKHSIEYISSLWRNKIPKMIAETAQNQYLNWYYTTQAYGKWKKCTRCGEVKLAHNRFFSKNKSSKDGWYSLCKCCRNKASKKKKEGGK